MALNFPITFSLAPLSTGLALDANQYGQALVANLQATISGAFLTGQIGGTQPTSDVGPWANNGHWWFWDAGTSMYVQENLTSSFPPGLVVMFGGVSAPTGFLLCNGSLQLRSTFSALFAIIGTTFGAGDGSSTFNLPDFRGRSPMGFGTGTGLTARTIGQGIGVETIALSTANLAAHNHVITVSNPPHDHGIAPNPHSHTYVNAIQSAGATLVAGSGFGFGADNTSGVTLNIALTATAVTATSANTGSGTAHANIQPTLVVNFIIKT